MIPNELRAMVWKLSLPDKLQLSQDLLSYISQDISNTIDELAQRKADYTEYLEYGGVPVENEFKIHKATRIAIDALEKQTSKKPKAKHKLGDTDPYVYGYCASCGEPINYEFQYCPACGQKAEWSDKK